MLTSSRGRFTSSDIRNPVSMKIETIALFLMSNAYFPEHTLKSLLISVGESAWITFLSTFGVFKCLKGLSIIRLSRSNQLKNVLNAL